LPEERFLGPRPALGQALYLLRHPGATNPPLSAISPFAKPRLTGVAALVRRSRPASAASATPALRPGLMRSRPAPTPTTTRFRIRANHQGRPPRSVPRSVRRVTTTSTTTGSTTSWRSCSEPSSTIPTPTTTASPTATRTPMTTARTMRTRMTARTSAPRTARWGGRRGRGRRGRRLGPADLEGGR
jgi:hypothetical protein